MIAMQYGITLPADYDMRIVDRRIAEKGPLPAAPEDLPDGVQSYRVGHLSLSKD